MTVVRGDLVHDRGAKQRTVHESEEPITGVEFRKESEVSTLFIATTSRILKLAISGRGQGQAARIVEDSGCGIGCMTLNKQNDDIVVVRDDAIYYYGVDGRGPCYAYDGPKSLVSVYGNYVALVSPPTTNTVSKKSSILRRFGGSQADEIFNTSTFTLLDTDLRFVAHSESLVSQVQTLFEIWGDLFTLTQNGKVSRSISGLARDTDSWKRSIAIMKSRCSKDSKYCISAIFLCQQLISLRELVWMPLDRMSYLGSMATSYTRSPTMMARWNNI